MMYGDIDPATNEDPQQWLRTIENMLDSGNYFYAEDTLEGIFETIEDSGRITSRQIQAITNIQQNPANE